MNVNKWIATALVGAFLALTAVISNMPNELPGPGVDIVHSITS